MSTERTTIDELAHHTDTPTLGVPREQLLTMAMLARTTAGALRSARERHGRASFTDADEAARIHLAADANAIDRLTPPQAREWNEKVAHGDLTVTRDDDSGLVLAHAGLSDGAEVVQATLGDRTVTVAAGSAATAAHLRDWLTANPHHDSLTDLRDAARDIADDRIATDQRLNQEVDAASATADEPGVDESATASPGATIGAGPSLRERLEGRVPHRVFDDARWPTAEKQFRDLVAEGANPDALADAAAHLNFDAKVRTPAGLVAWQMRKAAQGHTSPTDEDQARREAAAEWLAGAADTPTDRARASRLVGQIDTDFDRALAEKYPGILTAADPDGRWHDHTQRAASETDLAADHDQAAERAADDSLAVVHGPSDATAAAEHSAATDHEHTAADERDLAANADSERAEQAASVKAAAAPLARGRGQGTSRTPTPPSRATTHTFAGRFNTQTRTRGQTP